MKSKYEIDSDNVVRIWTDESLINEAPILLQPHSPTTGQPWSSREEAQVWALTYCSSIDSHYNKFENLE